MRHLITNEGCAVYFLHTGAATGAKLMRFAESTIRGKGYP